MANDDKKKVKEEKQVSITVSGGGKEEEPIGNETLKEAPGEFKETAPAKEVSAFIKPTSVVPEIPPEIEKTGVIKHTGPTTPIPKKPTSVNLPLTDEQIVRGLHAHIWESLRWLAVWCVRKLKKAHIFVREAHGRLIRSSSGCNN